MREEIELTIRKATLEDDLKRIAELLYKTDPYIYPYWFETLERCKEELPELIKLDNFLFGIENLYVAIDNESDLIAGIVCAIDKNAELDFDYTKLKRKNDRYEFTIENYILPLIEEVDDAEYVYISNVCVHEEYRGKHIGNRMLKKIIEHYRENLANTIVLDVIENNHSAVKLYKNLGFSQDGELYKGFSAPDTIKPNVFSMKTEPKKEDA